MDELIPNIDSTYLFENLNLFFVFFNYIWRIPVAIFWFFVENYHSIGSYLSILGGMIYLHQYVYDAGDYLLARYIITEENKKQFHFYKYRYITKNIWKSFMLFFIWVACTPVFLEGFFQERWSPLSFLCWGTLYVSLDVSGLVYVRGLPITTKAHHTTVFIFGLLNFIANYEIPNYSRSLLIYSYFSIVPCIVNFYLGYRYLEIIDDRRKLVAKISYWIYTASLSMNIMCQLFFFYFMEFHWSIIFYIFFFSIIIMDDLKLIKFLSKESLN